MITQDKTTGEVRLEDRPVRVEFLIKRGTKMKPQELRWQLIHAKRFLYAMGYDVNRDDLIEMTVIMQ